MPNAPSVAPPPGSLSAGSTPTPDAAEAQFQAMRQTLALPSKTGGTGLLLIGTLAVFVLTQFSASRGWLDVLFIVSVLLLHELGHLWGMKVFGYGNVKMFFIPFFGAAVSGKPLGAAGWKEGIVLLAGPLPGIVLGLVMAIGLTTGRYSSAWVASLANLLVLINAFNLLPVNPLDGGKLFNLVLFSRHRWLEIGFSAVAALVLLASFWLGLYLLPVIGVFMLVGLKTQWRMLGAAEQLRAQPGPWAGDPALLPEPQLRAAYAAAAQANDAGVMAHPGHAATAVSNLIERAAMRPPTFGVSALLMLPWLFGIAASVVALVLLHGN